MTIEAHKPHPDAVHDVCLCWRLTEDGDVLHHNTSFADIPVGTQFRVIYPPSPHASSKEWDHYHWRMIPFQVVMVKDRDGSMTRMYRQIGNAVLLDDGQIATFKVLVKFEATVREAQAAQKAKAA